ncbi:multicopper oxidase domain-containing protein [Streptomyces kaempferi]
MKAAITVERRKVRVGDRQLYATTYNGAHMPPTLRVRPGDRIDLTLTNHIDEDTNLHTHGLHVSPRAPADDIFIALKYNHSYHYSYRLPLNHPTGTYWYHSHADMMSAPQVAAASRASSSSKACGSTCHRRCAASPSTRSRSRTSRSRAIQ